ncbi:MAG: hypothetical protein CVV51_00920 [Spirochaetae bacterium HGW-Spirochaetae-7]|jgi:hypothetical protein|nr:MAG: hypothetical protein CVV51_00920 [Spirochaetae bacterium HGW-Spirochaetae-7]
MDTFNSLTPEIQQHLKQIAKTSGLPLNDESSELLAVAWLEKKAIFEKTLADNKLEEVAFYGQAEARGALALTWSGSIINIGPLVQSIRRCEYTSIGLRADVPPAATDDASELSADLEVDEPVQFTKGPIKTSSPVYKIAVASEALEPEEEEAMLTQVSQELAEDFATVNKTVVG